MQGRGWAAHKTSNLALARAYVKQYAPYLSPTLYGLVPSPMPGLRELVGGPLAVTERLVLLYEPDWVESVSTLVLATGLGHECLHDQLRHVVRGKSYSNRKRWNVAGDLFINSTMREQKKQVRRSMGNNANLVREPMWEFPDWVEMPERYGFKPGLTADEYYRLLEAYDAANPDGGCNAPDKNSDEPRIIQVMSGCCGGVAGNPLSLELEGKVDHEKGRSEADCKSIAKETAKAIKRHMESGAGRGDIPGTWSEFIEASDEVFLVPWRTQLANVARYSIGRARTGGLDYSRRRPSKRSALRGVVLPSLISYDPNVLFIVDSSGSMGNKQLADALRVCSDVLRQTGIMKAWFMEADYGKQRDPILVSVQDLRAIEILGRGGTDFRPAIAYAEKMHPRPNIIIYVTDGDGAAPATCPHGIHFIWCIVPTTWGRKPAEWGTTIVLDDMKLAAPIEVEEDDDEDE